MAGDDAELQRAFALPLACFETGVVLELSALAREAGITPHILQAKIRRETPLTATETAALVAALKRFRLATLA